MGPHAFLSRAGELGSETPTVYKCPMAEASAHPVADRRARVGLLVMDGLLVLLMAWLLWAVVLERESEEAGDEDTPFDGAAVEAAEGLRESPDDASPIAGANGAAAQD